ncbi:hypothetical protein [Rhodoferax sp.]|uniref:hypothetical protein n=1 Tax=Rhodoferax sp. TaxID=50421 RepID=UPI0025FAF3A5|nr:hypothetical protein [Rhodoferax sp.]MCM2342808.1 hypothetical protein [Rhodoferax sp.]
MTKTMKTLCTAAVLALLSSMAVAKLPAPELSDEAKVKAAEAAAKAAWAGKIDGFKLCQAQDKVVAHYKKAAPANACVDPGPFVYMPADAAPVAAAAPAASTAAPAKKP